MTTRAVFLPMFLCLTIVAGAQQVTSKAWVDSTTFRLGDWIVVHHEIRAPKELRVQAPSPKDSIGTFEIVSQTTPEESESDGMRVIEKSFTLTKFDSGKYVIPSIPTNYYKGNDTTVFQTFTQPIDITIRGVMLDTTQTFKDIKEVLHVSLTIWDYLLYGGIILLLAAAGYFGYRYYKKMKEKPPKEETPVAPPRPAHEIALEALSDLEKKHLWESGADKLYESEVTEIIRQYIENRHSIPALEMTSNDLISRLVFVGIHRELLEEMNTFFRCADMTKFAKYHPTPLEHQAAMRTAYRYVDATKITEETSVRSEVVGISEDHKQDATVGAA